MRWWYRLKAALTPRDQAEFPPRCAACGAWQCYRWVRMRQQYPQRAITLRVKRFYCWRCDAIDARLPYGWEFPTARGR